MRSIIYSALLFILANHSVYADKPVCRDISGTIQTLVSDPTCQVRLENFPEMTFPPIPACFRTTLTGQIGQTPVVGVALSGLTTNIDVGDTALSAVSVIHIFDNKNNYLGNVLTADTVVNADNPELTKEQLNVVEGSKIFKKARGVLNILGNVLSGPAAFQGKICVTES